MDVKTLRNELDNLIAQGKGDYEAIFLGRDGEIKGIHIFRDNVVLEGKRWDDFSVLCDMYYNKSYH